MLAVKLWAARCRKRYPLQISLPCAIKLCEHVHFHVHCFNTVLVLFCDSTNFLKWLMWRNNMFTCNNFDIQCNNFENRQQVMTAVYSWNMKWWKAAFKMETHENKIIWTYITIIMLWKLCINRTA
jgi:hypothetical protein